MFDRTAMHDSNTAAGILCRCQSSDYDSGARTMSSVDQRPLPILPQRHLCNLVCQRRASSTKLKQTFRARGARQCWDERWSPYSFLSRPS